HSGSRAVFDHPRNLNDARLRQLAAKGGVIQVNAYGGYLTAITKSPERLEAEKALETRFGEYDGMSMAQAQAYGEALKELDARYPVKKATLDDFLAHLGHILDVVGPEHTGIGMDWDGGGGVQGMEDVSQLPKITAWLLRKGYSEKQIA
ncbi:peptidase M19, partial [Kosakonia sp. H7A]|uniref:membrane dipeptidase n=1 Tax=Kosakonia sp. H7A TaxID=2054598 RepID=UPI000D429385